MRPPVSTLPRALRHRRSSLCKPSCRAIRAYGNGPTRITFLCSPRSGRRCRSRSSAARSFCVPLLRPKPGSKRSTRRFLPPSRRVRIVEQTQLVNNIFNSTAASMSCNRSVCRLTMSSRCNAEVERRHHLDVDARLKRQFCFFPVAGDAMISQFPDGAPIR